MPARTLPMTAPETSSPRAELWTIARSGHNRAVRAQATADAYRRSIRIYARPSRSVFHRSYCKFWLDVVWMSREARSDDLRALDFFYSRADGWKVRSRQLIGCSSR